MDRLRVNIYEEQSVRVVIKSVLEYHKLLGDGEGQPIEGSLHPAVRKYCDCLVMGTQGTGPVFFVLKRKLPEALIIPVFTFRRE